MNPTPPDSRPSLLLIGASVRAAAFSALRAGLNPQCADLFADRDLIARCPVRRLPSSAYPHGFLDLLRTNPACPWMYTGGLENYPDFVDAASRHCSLWGNSGDVLRRVRSPLEVWQALHRAGIPVPAVVHGDTLPPSDGRWLVKPLASAGGSGIRQWLGTREPKANSRPCYLQEFIEGMACAAVYVGDGRDAKFLGVTQQLVGEPWLHAAPFHYCGSVGPLLLDSVLRKRFEDLGSALSAAFALRGLFGVDAILREGIPYPVEINPRYTASVEVLEEASGISALALHARHFEPSVASVSPREPWGEVVGKAIVFAQESLVFTGLGVNPPHGVRFVDIPAVGEAIDAGGPVLTVLAQGVSVSECLARLEEMANALDRDWFVR